MKQQVDVVGAVIVRDGLVLCARRGPGTLEGLWEFPGGKVESEESPSCALRREIAEELSCEITVGSKVTTTVYEYESVVVALTTFWCELVSSEPTAQEHADLRWVRPEGMTRLSWAPADVPAVQVVIAGLAAVRDE